MKTRNLFFITSILLSSLTGCGRVKYNYTFTSEDENKGTVSVEGTIRHGNKVKLTATSNEYYTFSYWGREGYKGKLSTKEVFEYTLPERDTNVIAYFENQKYNVSANSTVFALSGLGDYKWGESVMINVLGTINSDENLILNSLISDEVEITSLNKNQYCFEMPKQDVVLKHVSEKYYYKMSVKCDEPTYIGSAYNDVLTPFNSNHNIWAMVWGNQWTNRVFDKWVDDDTHEVLSNNHSFDYVMPKRDVHITCHYKNANLTFGEYPQSKVTDSSLLVELDSINEFDEKGYIHFNDEKYLRSSGEYFKVEPIKWHIEVDGGDSLYIHSYYILDYRCFNNTSEIVNARRPNVFTYSDVRKWLKDVFTVKAFTQEEIEILRDTNEQQCYAGTYSSDQRHVVNCDNVYLPSTKIPYHYIKGATDYAKSKYSDSSNLVMTFECDHVDGGFSNYFAVSVINNDGYALYSKNVTELSGIAPSCVLDLSNGERLLLNY